jgi:hypothetical protein
VKEIVCVAQLLKVVSYLVPHMDPLLNNDRRKKECLKYASKDIRQF